MLAVDPSPSDIYAFGMSLVWIYLGLRRLRDPCWGLLAVPPFPPARLRDEGRPVAFAPPVLPPVLPPGLLPVLLPEPGRGRMRVVVARFMYLRFTGRPELVVASGASITAGPLNRIATSFRFRVR